MVEAPAVATLLSLVVPRVVMPVLVVMLVLVVVLVLAVGFLILVVPACFHAGPVIP